MVHLWCSRPASGLKWGSMGSSGLLNGAVVGLGHSGLVTYAFVGRGKGSRLLAGMVMGLECSGLLASMVMGHSGLLTGAGMGRSGLLAGAVMGHSGLLAGGFVGSCGAMDGDSGSDLIDLATVGLVLILFIILAFFIILLIIILLIILLILASSVGWLGSLEIRPALTCQTRWDDSAGSSNSGGVEALWRGNAHTTVDQFLFSPKIIIIILERTGGDVRFE